MKFSIILPTYKRPQELIRAVKSVLNQSYDNWEIIIINDSPEVDYTEFENSEYLKNIKIKYFKNKENRGNNFCKNFALENISQESDYILFLDDDDWINNNCLLEARNIIQKNKDFSWFVSNRYNVNQNKSLTINKLKTNKINYLKDYLIGKKFTGDATHIISTKYINKKFSKSVKNAEEWIYFTQLSKYFLYYDFNSTFSEGYSKTGITKNYKNKVENLKNTYKLFKENLKYRLFSFWILIYFILRIGAILFK